MSKKLDRLQRRSAWFTEYLLEGLTNRCLKINEKDKKKGSTGS